MLPDSSRAAGLRSVTKIKKEPPGSPNSSAKPRPRRLDLSVHGATGRGPQTARPAPLTARDSNSGLAIHDLGVACLSPGFQTQNPTMRSQLQRSLDVREQQRQIIEARQKGVKPPAEAPAGTAAGAESAQFNMPERTPSTSRRKGPPPGLSITAPSAATFSNERVIQSAPIHHSFTGLRQHAHQPSGLSQTSHIHHVPATQTANRLPPISDVFANDGLQAPGSARPPSTAMFATGHSPSIGPPPMQQSPGMMHHPQHHQPPLTGRGREFKSAEEAVQEMSRGRDDLLPKIVHYGGAQPPTPPSPMPSSQQPQQPQHPSHQQPYPPHPTQRQSPHASGAARVDALRSEHSQSQMAGRRRPRDEYEREHGSPLGQQEAKRPNHQPEGGAHDWRSNMSNQEKRDEFMRLCSRAWDLFHS
jgi:hypothetical protein